MPQWRMAEPVDFVLNEGEQLAIVGPNGGGKSMFVDMLTGRHPLFPQMVSYDFADDESKLVSDHLKYITFRDTYGGDNDRTYFLQQRWNQMEIDQQTPTAGSMLEEHFLLSGKDTKERRAMQQRIYRLFNMDYLLDKYIILLSSGELRKLKLAIALFAQPSVLILDNPFIGLDAPTREQLRLLLEQLSKEHILQLILVFSKTDDIPHFITHVVEVHRMKVGSKMTLDEYLTHKPASPSHVLSSDRRNAILHLNEKENNYSTDEIVKMNQVTIRYGNRTILNNLDWTVRNGERWALSGCNGSGKATLLWTSSGEWREHLGNQKAHRLRVARDAPLLPTRHACHTYCSQRSKRLGGIIRKTRRE